MSKLVTLFAPAHPQTFCQIDPIGCSIAELWLNGVQVLWSGTRPDGGTGITHPCIPNFNLAQDLPNHGPARKAEWFREDDLTWSWRMTEIEGVYPTGIEATRTFELDQQSLTVTTTISNQAAQNLPINIAEHHYFVCPPQKRSDVTIDGQPFHPEALTGIAQFKSWKPGEHIINIPELGKVQITVSGYGAFAQWSLPESAFVCIEPIQALPPQPEAFLKKAPRIKAGETKVFTYRLELVN